MPILCEPTTVSTELALCIGGQVRASRSLEEAARCLEFDPGEVLVVIGPGIDAAEALGFSAALRVARPFTGVILVRHQIDVGLLSGALQAGIREVISASDPAALAVACQRSRDVTNRLITAPPHHEIAGPVTPGRIVTVFAAKGGCGKTTLAINLAVALARFFEKKVCVVDLDLAFGDVAISVQLDPVKTVVDALPMAGHLDTTGAASLLTRYRPGLSMLLAPVTPGDAERVPPSLVGELLSVLNGMFDFVIVDTPAQFSEHVLIAMDASAHHVLLTTPDVAALKNLRLTLDMLDLLSYSRSIRSTVLNRSDSKVGLGPEDIERAVHSRIAAQVPSHRAVPVSINKGVPITIGTPRHPVSQAIIRFAETRLLPAPAAHPAGHRPAARIRRPA